jgi:hypothetical protein
MTTLPDPRSWRSRRGVRAAIALGGASAFGFRVDLEKTEANLASRSLDEARRDSDDASPSTC